MITILLVDDQPSVLQGLRMRLALEPDVTVVGQAAEGKTALGLAAALRPDVVVLDVRMPEMDGMEVATALRSIAPGTAVVILTMFDDLPTRRRALAVGVAAFVGKSQGEDTLPSAIRQAAVQRQYDG